jgi:hypothetical protein
LPPIDRGYVVPVKGVNPAALPEPSGPVRLCGVDLEVKYFKGSYEQLPTVNWDDNVIPEDGHFL